MCTVHNDALMITFLSVQIIGVALLLHLLMYIIWVAMLLHMLKWVLTPICISMFSMGGFYSIYWIFNDFVDVLAPNCPATTSAECSCRR